MLLLSSNPERSWSAAEVSQHLRYDGESAARRLSDLERKGLITCQSGRYVFLPKDESLKGVVAALAKAYVERRVAIINMIFAKPLERIQVFADAFRLRKDKDHG